ncbi:carbohydrate ABC transporter permease [Treponema sp.]|uniref:carbohydrate ABC transporter permease n=1 Tax=Treponema sp. TaxID=166 RepID=UPI003F0E67D2
MNSKIHERQIVKWLKYILLCFSALTVVLPILVVFLGSFKTGEEFNRSRPFDLPKFESNNEIWKGAETLGSGSRIELKSGILSSRNFSGFLFLYDKIEDGAENCFIAVSDSSGREIARAELSAGSEEVFIPVSKDDCESLKASGAVVSGENCTVIRAKIREGFLFENYKTAFIKGNMLLGFWNTFLLILFSGAGTVVTGSMTAFVLSRFNFKMKKIVRQMFLWISLIPTITTQVATFQIIQKLGMYNTHLSVIILSMGTDIIAIMIYLQFLNNISKSLDESAIIDGAGYFQVFVRIIFPLLQPATVTILILKCVNLYNDFYNPLLYMPKKSLQVISTSLYKFKGPFGTNWPVICAGVVIAVIPTLIAFISLQRYIYGGMVTGSVKE